MIIVSVGGENAKDGNAPLCFIKGNFLNRIRSGSSGGFFFFGFL